MAEISDHTLAGVNKVVHDAGSVIIGMALLDGEIDGEEAFDAAFLEELYQLERWGHDAHAEARITAIKRDILAAECFIQLSLKA